MDAETENEPPSPTRRRGRPARKSQAPAAESADPFHPAPANQPEPLEQMEPVDGGFPEELPPANHASPGNFDISRIAMALAIVVFLFSQLAGLSQNADSMAWQSRNLDRQIENLRIARENVAGLVQQRQTVVDQAQRVTSSYNELFNDLLRLAETDKDARTVVEKFQIKNAIPPASPK